MPAWFSICKRCSAVTKSGILLFCCHQASHLQGEFVASWTWVVWALCVVELCWDGDVVPDPAGLWVPGFGSCHHAFLLLCFRLWSYLHTCCWGLKFTFPNLWPAQAIFTWCPHLPLLQLCWVLYPWRWTMFQLPVKVGERRQCFELKRNILIYLQICKWGLFWSGSVKQWTSTLWWIGSTLWCV